MLETFRAVLSRDEDDGVVFDADALCVDRIREELEYGGLRLRTTASISGARINLTIGVGFCPNCCVPHHGKSWMSGIATRTLVT